MCDKQTHPTTSFSVHIEQRLEKLVAQVMHKALSTNVMILTIFL